MVYKKNNNCPPKKYNGSCLDGRDITYKILPDADLVHCLLQISKQERKDDIWS